jgi:hypothetical protein
MFHSIRLMPHLGVAEQTTWQKRSNRQDFETKKNLIFLLHSQKLWLSFLWKDLDVRFYI